MSGSGFESFFVTLDLKTSPVSQGFPFLTALTPCHQPAPAPPDTLGRALQLSKLQDIFSSPESFSWLSPLFPSPGFAIPFSQCGHRSELQWGPTSVMSPTSCHSRDVHFIFCLIRGSHRPSLLPGSPGLLKHHSPGTIHPALLLSRRCASFHLHEDIGWHPGVAQAPQKLHQPRFWEQRGSSGQGEVASGVPLAPEVLSVMQGENMRPPTHRWVDPSP